jgi:hypothetical protein
MPKTFRDATKDWPSDRRERVRQRARELVTHVEDDPPALSELLRGFEEAVEEVRRLSRVLRAALEGQQRGERLPDGVAADYLERLTDVDADRERWEEQIVVAWALVSGDAAVRGAR